MSGGFNLVNARRAVELEFEDKNLTQELVPSKFRRRISAGDILLEVTSERAPRIWGLFVDGFRLRPRLMLGCQKSEVQVLYSHKLIAKITNTQFRRLHE